MVKSWPSNYVTLVSIEKINSKYDDQIADLYASMGIKMEKCKNIKITIALLLIVFTNKILTCINIRSLITIYKLKFIVRHNHYLLA